MGPETSVPGTPTLRGGSHGPCPEASPAPEIVEDQRINLAGSDAADKMRRTTRPIYHFAMSPLSRIEAEVDSLSDEQKQELFLFLAARLRAVSGRLPPPRKFPRDQVNKWITEDEADMRRLRGTNGQ